MRKYILSLLVLFFAAQLIVANVITGVAAIPDGYYNGVDQKSSPTAILAALNTIIKGHTVINYDGLEPYYQQTDFYADTLWDMYSTCRFVAEDANKQQKAVCDGWNKEHVCCQSWLGSGPMVSDLYNVYPTDARVNNLRSNYPYGVVANNKGISKDPNNHALGKLGSSKLSGAGSDVVYEPDDRYKGDFARTFFYMVARYRENTLNSGNGSAMFTSSPTDLTSYSLSFLLQWHRQDPVSEKEIDRNQAVYGIQKNRNPFIDYPDLVEYIWGNKKNQTVNLSSLTPTCEGGGEGGGPVPTAMYGVSWSVNGTIVQVDSIAEAGKISVLPATPVSCSNESETFIGWTNAPINGTTNNAPAILYTKPSDFPAVTADVTYFAVFAHAEEKQGQGSVTETNELNTYKRGDKVPSITIGDIAVTFSKAIYYSELRCYGKSTLTFTGATMTKIEFAVGNEDKGNELKPNVGAMTTSALWQGNADNVVFTVDGDSGYRGIGAITVTYNGGASATIVTYSNYLTSCGTQAIDNTSTQPAARKILRDGQLYILIGETYYTITGQKVSNF